MGWLRTAGAAVAVLVLLYAGWTAAGWRAEAMQLQVAKLELRNELQRRVASDAARLDIQNKLTAAQEALAKKLNTTLKAIQSHDPKSPDCDVPDDIASQLSNLRQAN